jgi:hypothetical protein
MGMVSMKISSAAAVSQQVGQTTGGAKLFSEPEIRAEFCAIVVQFTPRQLSKFSGATPEGARHWVDGSRMANVTNTLNLARSMPSVQMWLADRSGYQRAVQAVSADAVIQWAIAHRAADGQDGTIARAILRELATPTEKRPPAASDDRGQSNLFDKRRA